MTTSVLPGDASVQELYAARLTTPEEAVRVVSPGQRVAIPFSHNPIALTDALAARLAGELAESEGVEIGHCGGGGRGDYLWLRPGFPGVSGVVHEHFGSPTVRGYLRSRQHDFAPIPLAQRFKGYERARTHAERRETDVLLLSVSPPDQHGYMSLGAPWYILDSVKHASYVLGEVSPRVPRFYGAANLIHVSQFHALVEHDPGALVLPERVPTELERTLAGYIAEIVEDGDTVQTGIGLAFGLVTAGALDGKRDLGWHSEGTAGGAIDLMRKGIITGAHKSIDRGKAVSVFWIGNAEQMAFCEMNPSIEAHPTTYVHNLRTIAAQDNMIAINNALAIDLTGQITADSLGHEMIGGTGGQTEFAIGAVQAKNGRSVTLLESTAAGDTVSRIMPALPDGTIVSVPRMYADIIMTEYGVARLWGKTAKERAQALVKIAHPRFREELAFEAKRLFGA